MPELVSPQRATAIGAPGRSIQIRSRVLAIGTVCLGQRYTGIARLVQDRNAAGGVAYPRCQVRPSQSLEAVLGAGSSKGI